MFYQQVLFSLWSETLLSWFSAEAFTTLFIYLFIVLVLIMPTCTLLSGILFQKHGSQELHTLFDWWWFLHRRASLRDVSHELDGLESLVFYIYGLYFRVRLGAGFWHDLWTIKFYSKIKFFDHQNVSAVEEGRTAFSFSFGLSQNI